MAYPNGTSANNHGLLFQGYAPHPGENRLFFLDETGFTPEIGASKLEGKYAFGVYAHGESAAEHGNKYGFYWQADQMIYREQSSKIGEGGNIKLSDEGLSVFSLFVFAPSYNSNYPFYTQGGLAYKGLIPGRGKDTLYAGYGLGTYSDPDETHTMVIEGGYRFRLNGWSSVSPYFQYLSRPDGTSEVANAAVLGVQLGIDF
jgi:porin